jgi:hypothetical protein
MKPIKPKPQVPPKPPERPVELIPPPRGEWLSW